MTEYQAAWLIYSGALIAFFITLSFWVCKIQSIFWRSFLLAGLALFNAAFVVVEGVYSPLLAKVAVDVISGRFSEVVKLLPYMAALLAVCFLIAWVSHKFFAAKNKQESA